MTALAPSQAIALDLPADLSVEEWRDLGKDLFAQTRNLNWLVGDWYRHGQAHFPEQLELALTQVAEDPKTLAKIAQVAETFSSDERRADLSFQHHACVVALPIGEATSLLIDASADHTSLREFRKVAKHRKAQIEQTTIFADEDWEHAELMSIARAWNRARPSVRQEFRDLVEEADWGVVDP